MKKTMMVEGGDREGEVNEEKGGVDEEDEEEKEEA